MVVKLSRKCCLYSSNVLLFFVLLSLLFYIRLLFTLTGNIEIEEDPLQDDRKTFLENNLDVVYLWHTFPEEKTRQDDFELRYSLRSLEKYVSWVRKIFIVTDGELPEWLNMNHEKIKIVSKEEISKGATLWEIEKNLFNLPGISKSFLYFSNKYCIFVKPMRIEHWWTKFYGYKLHFRPAEIPGCAPGCYWRFLHDGQCDSECYNEDCDFDDNDCNQDNRDIMSGPQKNERWSAYPLGYPPNLREISSAKLDPTILMTLKILIENLGHQEGINYISELPIMIDFKVYNDLYKHFLRGKYRKFNLSNLNFRYLYQFYIKLKRVKQDFTNIIHHFDMDKDGLWSETEIYNILKNLSKDYNIFQQLLSDCLESQEVNILNKNDGNDDERTKTKILALRYIENCKEFKKFLLANFEMKSKYKFKAVHHHNESLGIISSTTQLSKLIKDKNFNNCYFLLFGLPRRGDYEKWRKLLGVIFPFPSNYELPEGFKNKFLHMDELKSWQQSNKAVDVPIIYLKI